MKKRYEIKRPFSAKKRDGKEWVIGPNTTWLWTAPTTFEAVLCLNGAYADGFKAGVRAASKRGGRK